MNRALLLVLAMNLVACWPAPGSENPSSDESPANTADEASAAEPANPPEPEPPAPLIQAVFPDSSPVLTDCVSVADGFVCALGTDEASLVYVDSSGTTRPVAGEQGLGQVPTRLFALSPSSVVMVRTNTTAGNPHASSTISRTCEPWESLAPLVIIESPVVDYAQSAAGLAVLQGGNADPQLAFIPSDCDLPIVTLPLPEARTVSAVAFDQSGAHLAVTGLRSRSLHVFSVQTAPLSLVAETRIDLPIQPYVLASNGPSSWVIMGANSEVATTLNYATGEPVFGELTFPAPLHRLATTEHSWAGWSASDQALYVGDWADTTRSLPLNGFPNLRSLAFTADGRVIGVDESGGFVMSESTGLVRESLENVISWVSGSTQTWAISDQNLFELVP